MPSSRYAYPVSLTRVHRIAVKNYERTLRRWYGEGYADKMSREERQHLAQLHKNVVDRKRFVCAQYAKSAA